ncbi:MAG TPA: hypothetical protein ENI92_07015, partial [Bacteroidetes bacterium]|nr:hypothetical protein [Bacteroidota bacterium]
MELFTNTSCTSCSVSAPVFRSFIEEHRSQVAVVAYHLGWPGDSDPWYLLNPVVNTQRGQAYAIDSLPAVFVDGTAVDDPGDGAALEAAFRARIQEESPLSIDIEAHQEGDSLFLDLHLHSGWEAITGDTRLRTALVAARSVYDAPSGQEVWVDDLLAMLPGAAGVMVTMPPDDSLAFSYHLPAPEGEPVAGLRAMAFVQREGTLEVLQAASSGVTPAYGRAVESGSPASLVQPGSPALCSLRVRNTGYFPDQYTLAWQEDFPGGWASEVDVPGGVRQGDTVLFSLQPGGETIAEIEVIPGDARGAEGRLLLQLTSQQGGERVDSLSLFVLTAPEVLVFAGDTVGTMLDRYRTALASAGATLSLSWGLWNLGEYGLDLRRADELAIPAVLWTVDRAGALGPGQQAALLDYATRGGRLWIAGAHAALELAGTELLARLGATLPAVLPVPEWVEG